MLALPAAWYTLRIGPPEAPRRPPRPVMDLPAPAADSAACPALSYVVKRGDTFGGILAGFGVMDRAASDYYRDLVGVGLAALFPGDSMVLDIDNGGRLLGLSLLSRLQCWYRVRQEADRVRAGRYPLETAVHLCCAKGTLVHSLSEDMGALGEDDALVGRLTEIFAWDVNFFTDPRVGDRFEVLFEKRYAGGRFVGYGEVLAARYVNSGRVYRAFGLREPAGGLRYYDAEGRSVQKQFLKAPLRFTHISSGFSFGRVHPILGTRRPHTGVDYAAPSGTPVYAAADGVVRSAGREGGYGNLVVITHGAAYTTYYGHLQAVQRGIYAGARVVQGQVIGTVGSTGLATGPHLDYRMAVSSRFVNPQTIVLPSGAAVSEENRAAFERGRDRCGLLLDQRFVNNTGSWVLEISTERPLPTERFSAGKESPDRDNAAGS